MGPYKPALAINGLVTGIATYHYFRIFNSWNDSFEVFYDTALERYVVNSSGLPFNDAYRYVDWLLTVPLLLIELILVMQLPAEESSRKMWALGTASAFMVAFGYPGEIRDDPAGRWFYWSVSMCPFMYVLYELYVGLAEATTKHAPSVASLIASARYLTAISWLTYPFVYMLKGDGLRAGGLLYRGCDRQGRVRHHGLAHRAREDPRDGGAGVAFRQVSCADSLAARSLFT